MGSGVLKAWSATRSFLRVPTERLDTRNPRWVVHNIRVRTALRVRLLMKLVPWRVAALIIITDFLPSGEP